jgi:hypothetical protein
MKDEFKEFLSRTSVMAQGLTMGQRRKIAEVFLEKKPKVNPQVTQKLIKKIICAFQEDVKEPVVLTCADNGSMRHFRLGTYLAHQKNGREKAQAWWDKKKKEGQNA